MQAVAWRNSIGISAELGVTADDADYDDRVHGGQRTKEAPGAALLMGIAPYLQLVSPSARSRLLARFHYRQVWPLEAWAWQEFADTSFDLGHLPFPLGLLERSTRWSIFFEHRLGRRWIWGLWSDVKLYHVGSRFTRQDDPRVISRSIFYGDRLLCVPWLQYTWTSGQRSVLALPLMRTRYHYFTDLSTSTFPRAPGPSALSSLVYHEWSNILYDTSLSLFLERSFFTSRSPLASFLRYDGGIALGHTPSFMPNLGVDLSLNRFVDIYSHDEMELVTRDQQTVLDYTPRRDQGYRLRAQLRYVLADKIQLAILGEIRKNTNPAKNVGDLLRRHVMLTVTFADLASLAIPTRPEWFRGDYSPKRSEVNRHFQRD